MTSTSLGVAGWIMGAWPSDDSPIVHHLYEIRMKKGLLGRGQVKGHLQIEIHENWYAISMWAEAITKKLLFLSLGTDHEDDVGELTLDREHLNPLRIRSTAFGRVESGRLVSEGVAVYDKVTGEVYSHLAIRDMPDGKSVVTYSTIGKGGAGAQYRRHPNDPLTAMISIARGASSVYTVSLRTLDGAITLNARELVPDRVPDGIRLNTAPDAAGRFWDFKADTLIRCSGGGVSQLESDAYNAFTSIDARMTEELEPQELGLDDTEWLMRK